MRRDDQPAGHDHGDRSLTFIAAPESAHNQSMEVSRAELAVIGAGILGLAVAAEFLRRRPGLDVVVLEKEDSPAQHQTGRNSGVIHSGVYYEPGSLKARLCTRGRTLLLEFCEAEGVQYEICGKVIVAVDRAELPRLETLYERATANGVPVERFGPEGLREFEPHCTAIAALHVPTTGLVDYRAVAAALVRRIESEGGRVLPAARVLGIADRGDAVQVQTARGALTASRLIACAGVHADALAGVDGGVRILPFRGDYFALRPEARRLCRNLIYPVPDPRFPFLGVHVNRRPGGEVWAGPNAVVALAREGYRRRDVRLREAWSTLTYPGFRRFARRHWRTGAAELYRDLVRRAYAAQARRYLPELSAVDLTPAPAGIRAQAVRRDGTLVDDFLFASTARVLHVRNAPSPAATSALAIAEHIADSLN
jgi:(S)-2-hydroxyglutarate dehydrogenase